ncbi:MAG: DUF4375 domain-containing protein [Acutalibacteraceae bacterium]
MYYITIKATHLFESGKKEKAIELLCAYASRAKKFTDKVLKAYEMLVDFKAQLGLDFSEELLIIEENGKDDISGHVLFRLSQYYYDKGNIEKAKEYYYAFEERVPEKDEYIRLFGLDVAYHFDREEVSFGDEIDIYDICEHGEKLEVLTEKQRDFILCDSFVSMVNSDGLDSYFSSPFSRYCKETAVLLKKIGAKTYADVLEKSISFFGSDFDFSDEEKTEDYIFEHGKISEKFEKLEEKIYDSGEENIEELLKELSV